jgi:hypothetical protein
MAALYSRESVEKHSLDMRQFVGFRQSALPNGVRVVDAYNTSGLRYTILVDRGLDIWTADFRGLPLTWVAQGSPMQPDFGMPWLQQFPGGLLVTCGLTHVGPPERDDATGEFRDLHGLYTRMRASEPSISGAWEGDDYVLRLTATIAEGWLHGYQLRLTRTYELSLTAPEIRLHDVVTNLTDKPVPLMILYHFNLGYPMIRAGTLLAASGATVPRDDEARKGLATWWGYTEAQSGYVEQVFFHHVQVEDGWTEAALLTGDALGLGFRYNADALPYLTQWKNLRQGMYVHGVEPGNCIPEGRNAAQKHGRLDLLGAGETRDMGQITLTVYSDAYEITQLRGRLDTLRNTGTPVAGFGLGTGT